MKPHLAWTAVVLLTAWSPPAMAESDCDYWTRYLKSIGSDCASVGVCDDLPEIKGNIRKFCGTANRNDEGGKAKRKKLAGAGKPSKPTTASGSPAEGGSNPSAAQTAESPPPGNTDKPESSAGDCGPYTYRFGNPDNFKQGTEPWADATCGMSVPPMCNTFAGDNYGSFQACRDALITHPLGEGAYQNPKRLRGN